MNLLTEYKSPTSVRHLYENKDENICRSIGKTRTYRIT